MRDSMINTCGMKMRKLLEKKSEVLVQKYGVRNVELTQKAEEAAKKMLEVHNDCKRIIMRYVTEEEKAVMDRVMQKMLRAVWMRNFKSNRISLIRRKECSI